MPPEVLCALQSDYEHALRHHLLGRQLLTDVSSRFDEAKIEYVVVKGPVLAETVYPRSDLRVYGDVDLLVRPEQFGEALVALEGGGARLYEANWELMLRTMRGELNLLTALGAPLDLHWSLFHDAATKTRVFRGDAAR